MTSIVIPSFNEEGRIVLTIERCLAFLRDRRARWEILVVDDGSRDRTAAVVRERFGDRPEIRVLREETNHGKGWAVRFGARAAAGDLVLFTDADLSTPIEELGALETRAAEGFDLVVASRVVAGARIVSPQPFRRRLSGWIFRNLVRVLGLTSVRDTQCGFKLMRRATVGPILDAIETDGFAFDVELLRRAERAGLRVVEVPVEWHDSAGSKVRLFPDALRMAWDLVRLRWRLRG